MQGSGFKAQGIASRYAAISLLAVAGLAGCRQDMHDQPKFVPQRGSEFFADGRSARPQVENTVARGQLHEDSYFYTGMVGGQEGTAMPFPATATVLARGQERYNVYCTPCHSRVGNGAGMIVQRGYAQAGNFHTARLQAAPLGHFFNVITNGYGAMPDYSAQVTPADRWAIVAYIKALQLSQNASVDDVAPGQHVEPLQGIADREGLTEPKYMDWAVPATAVTGTPNGQPFDLMAKPSAAPAPAVKPASAPTPTPATSTGAPVKP
jgi:mono/diheme cytochrome c family protein